MFFIRTEERVITREVLLELGKKEGSYTEYLASIICDDQNGRQEYVSGVSTIQKRWDPDELRYRLRPSKPADIMDILMSEEGEMAEEDLAMLQKIIEGATAYYMPRPDTEAAMGCGLEDDHTREIWDLVMACLCTLCRQEYCRLVWNGSIRCTVKVRRWPNKVIKYDITSGAKLKYEAEEAFFGHQGRRWQSVNDAFRAKMLRFPETMAIVKFREYFDAMAKVLETKAVPESESGGDLIRVWGRPVYCLEEISERLGTRLVDAVLAFGLSIGEHTCYRAVYELERIQKLQAELHMVTDKEVKDLVREMLDILEQNMDILKAYFDIWDAYVEGIIFGDRSVDEYMESMVCAAPGTDNFENPWLKIRDSKHGDRMRQ